MSDTQPIDTDEVQSLAQDAMEKRPWPHVDAVLYPDKPRYTADELRQFAKAKKEQVVREKKELERTKRRMTIADANRWVILEQDADALEQGADAMDALAKAEARVKELEDALKPFAVFAERFRLKPMRGLDDVLYAIHSGETEREAELRLSDCDKAAAALQVKP